MRDKGIQTPFSSSNGDWKSIVFFYISLIIAFVIVFKKVYPELSHIFLPNMGF